MNDMLEERGLPANKTAKTALGLLNFGRRFSLNVSSSQAPWH